MTTEQKAMAFKMLTKYPEWQVFVDHIKETAQVHCDSSVQYSSKGKHEDASRQAWIAEGLVEAIDVPQSVIEEHNFSVKGIVQTVCHLCGQGIEKILAR